MYAVPADKFYLQCLQSLLFVDVANPAEFVVPRRGVYKLPGKIGQARLT